MIVPSAIAVAVAAPTALASARPTILVLGDSISAAYGIQREQGWVAHLERRVAELDPPWQVVNASVSGETTGGGAHPVERHRFPHLNIVMTIPFGRPVDPVTGQDVPAPIVMRYAPSANLGDIDWASLVAIVHPGAFDVFATLSYMQSDPNNVTTPFGGLFSDPFETPEKQDGYAYYVGARYNLPNDKTKIGLEYNYGSEYWFNFAPAEDDIIAPKTNTRGDVWELYVTHRIAKKFVAKLDFVHYAYDYSGSGWHMGAPKELDSTPILGFPSPTEANRFLLGLQARF